MALLAMLTLGGITGARATESASGSSPEGEQERLMAISVTVAIPGVWNSRGTEATSDDAGDSSQSKAGHNTSAHLATSWYA
ncbi:hypothetical protein KSF_102530 [Reticulibacter mediterranei]|uniref:Uncharacterized protein n=1 Tax=Reticulibacter mediterranei TaxID=2778369 RepID=A0A8J3IXB7_9CHLR|nr:hypothetical protein [Reticulibacter mediterranei]GHP00206.1 hypothetical protein KSF_102530 [Reticulibacter mediterranei]